MKSKRKPNTAANRNTSGGSKKLKIKSTCVTNSTSISLVASVAKQGRHQLLETSLSSMHKRDISDYLTMDVTNHEIDSFSPSLN